MTDKPTNFITRHVATLRELAASMSEAPGLAEILGKSANIIEQVVDGNAAVRAEHVRVRTELEVQIGALEAQLTAAHQHIAALTSSTAITPTARTPPTQTWHALPCDPDDLNALIQLMPGGWAEIEWQVESSTFVVVNAWGITPAVFDGYEWQDLHPEPGPGMHHKRHENCFEHWPQGRRCFAEPVGLLFNRWLRHEEVFTLPTFAGGAKPRPVLTARARASIAHRSKAPHTSPTKGRFVDLPEGSRVRAAVVLHGWASQAGATARSASRCPVLPGSLRPLVNRCGAPSVWRP